MKTVLFIDACVRGEHSRTLKIAECYIEELKKKEEFTLIKKTLDDVDLSFINSKYFDPETGEQLHASTELAEEFAAADEIVVAAPYWEFLFPAMLSCYFEKVSIVGVAFKYTPTGSAGLCRAKSLKYIYTAGAPLGEDDKLCERYLEKLCQLYGIPNFSVLMVDALDIETNDATAMINAKCDEIKKG